MKPNAFLQFLFGSSSLALLAAPSLHAVPYYWDSDGNTAGFGNTAGTWGTNAFWSSVASGGATHTGVTNMTTSDVANFGSPTLNYSNSSVGVAAGGVTATSIVFGAGQTTALTIGSASSGTITLGGATRTIIANRSGHSVLAPIELTGTSIVRLAFPPPSAAVTSLTLGALSGTGGVTFENTAGGNPNPATFVLKGASTYSGNTILQSTVTNAGVELRLDVDDALPTTTVLNLQGAAGPSGGSNRNTSLNLNGSDQTLAGLSNSGGGALRTFRVFSSSASTLTIDGTSSNTFAGLIGNGGTNISIVKAGSGIQTFSGANTYVGLTTVDGGGLRIQHASGLGNTAAGTVVNGSGTAGTANARLELAGGITVSGESLTISGVGNFNGALTSTSNDNIWAGNVTIGAAGTRLGASAGASLEISGTIDSGVATHGIIIRTADSTGSVILSGANTYLGNTQVLIGNLQLAGGDNRLPVGTTLTFGSSGTNADAEFDLNGRNQQVAGLALTGTASKNSVNNSSLTGSTLTVNNADTSTFGGILKGNLGLTKTAGGTLTLTGDSNTYTGLTTVNDGTLALGVDGTIDDTSGVVLGGGTFDVSAKAGGYTVDNLSGVGTVIGSLNVTTQLAIGNSPGTVEFENLTLNSGATYLYDLTGGGLTADLGNVSDTLTLTGAILDLVQLGNYTLDDKFTLFAYQTGSLTGTFSGLADGAEFTDAGGLWKVNYFDTSAGLNGGTGTSFVTITAVPEPRAALLGGIGLIMFFRRRR